jgi:hypothetical protein
MATHLGICNTTHLGVFAIWHDIPLHIATSGSIEGDEGMQPLGVAKDNWRVPGVVRQQEDVRFSQYADKADANYVPAI